MKSRVIYPDNPKEDVIQRAVAQHLDLRAKQGVVWWHTPNGGYRNAVEAARFKGQGVKAGVPDVIIFFEGQLYALELKAASGKLSQAQKDMLSTLQANGARIAVAYSIDEAVIVLEQWGVLR